MNNTERTTLRKLKIKARNSLSRDEREMLSEQIVEKILTSKEFQNAETVLIYRCTKGEVRLDALESAVESQGKRLAFPLCINSHEMIALLPANKDAWKEGYCGIWEPIREQSEEIPPEEIDMVICPCTVFDERGGRMGMGAGFYDRYLEKCKNAFVASVAFEIQKADSVPMAPWDRSMEMVFTEKTTYVKPR